MEKNSSTSSQDFESNKTETPSPSVLIGEVAESAKAVAGDLATRARRVAEQQISEAKQMAAERIGNVADALRNTGDQLRSQNVDSVSGYVDQAVDRLDAASDYLQERSFSDLISDAAAFARREPAIVFGSAFVLGLIAGRFLKSSGARPSTETQTTAGASPSGQTSSKSIGRARGSSEPAVGFQGSSSVPNPLSGYGLEGGGEPSTSTSTSGFGKGSEGSAGDDSSDPGSKSGAM